MPQMSPLNWVTLFFILMLSILLIINNFNKESLSSMTLKTMKKKEIPMKW